MIFINPYLPLTLPISLVLYIYTGKATVRHGSPSFLQSTISLTLREAFSYQRIEKVPREFISLFPASAFPPLGILFGDP